MTICINYVCAIIYNLRDFVFFIEINYDTVRVFVIVLMLLSVLNMLINIAMGNGVKLHYLCIEYIITVNNHNLCI